jgi:hypothetical protein
MTIMHEPLALDEKVVSEPPAEPYSRTWWEGRSPEQLRELVQGGFQAGTVFESAVQEIERRARELTRRARVEAAAEQARRRRLQRLSLAGIALLLAIIVAVGVWSGLQ